MFSVLGLRSQPFWTSPSSTPRRIAYDDPYVKSVCEAAEAAYGDIKEEYMSGVMGVGSGLQNLDTGSTASSSALPSDYSDSEHSTLHKGQWDWHSYIQRGARFPAFAERCPKTAAFIDSLGPKLFSTPFSYCFFSTLHPGAKIEPHSSSMNLRLRVHLPLIVPKSSKHGIACGASERTWEEGRCTVLDDSYVHHVFNDTEEPRVVLLFDIWHPDIVEEERRSIEEMFEYSQKMGWMSK